MQAMRSEFVNLGDLTLIGAGSLSGSGPWSAAWSWPSRSSSSTAGTQGPGRGERVPADRDRPPPLGVDPVLLRLEVALQLRDGTLDVADDTRPDAVLGFFGLVRDLNRQGYLDDEEIARSFGAAIVVWWRLLEPVVQAQSALEGDPEMWSGLLTELQAVVAGATTKSAASTGRWFSTCPSEELLAIVIKRETHRLRLARDAASGYIPGGTDVAGRPTGDDRRGRGIRDFVGRLSARTGSWARSPTPLVCPRAGNPLPRLRGGSSRWRRAARATSRSRLPSTTAGPWTSRTAERSANKLAPCRMQRPRLSVALRRRRATPWWPAGPPPGEAELRLVEPLGGPIDRAKPSRWPGVPRGATATRYASARDAMR